MKITYSKFSDFTSDKLSNQINLIKLFISFTISFLFWMPDTLMAQTQTNYLYLSDPAQALDRLDPVNTADNTTAQTVTLSSSAASVTVDAVSSSTGAVSTMTIPHNTGNGTNRLMLVGITMATKNVTSITYNGVALNLVGTATNSNGNRAKSYIYSLINPSVGINNLIVNFSTASGGTIVGVMTFNGVDQTNPLGAYASSTGSSTIASLNVNSVSGDLVYSCTAGKLLSTPGGGGQAEYWDLISGTESGVGSLKTATAASTPFSNTFASSGVWAIGGVAIKPAPFVNNTTFTQNTPLCDSIIIKAGTITVTNYVSVISGSMPANPNITAVVKYGSTTISTLTNPSYNSSTGLLTWNNVLGADVIVPAGSVITLQITTAQAGVFFKIDFDSQTKPSKIALPLSTNINVNSFNVYNAPYPGGLPVTTSVGGATLYARAVVSNPFGINDITSTDITISPPGTTVAASVVASSGCTKTYEYIWSVPASAGSYTITAIAKEGFENTITSVKNTTVVVCTVCPPVTVNDNAIGSEGNPVLVDVLANDYDPNNNMNNASLSIFTQALNGTAYIYGNKILYLPNGSYSGTDSVFYQICDNTSPTPLCTIGKLNITIGSTFNDPCSDATNPHLYYITYPENEARIALDNSTAGTLPSNNIRSIISLKIPYSGMTVFWDHWEDGYETDIMNPVQSTTKIWGDGNPFNGIAPGYANDLIPAGGSIVLDNIVPTNPRVSSNIYYDGRDKLLSNGFIAVTQVCGEPSIIGNQCMKTTVTSTTEYGNSFTVPVGQNFPSQDFRYTALFIRAYENNTTVNIDKDNNGTFETTTVLNEGASYFIDGGVLSGASITSSLPVGVDVHFGGVDVSGYTSREAPIFPATWYSNVYYSAVPTTKSPDTAVVMLYNNLTRSITINWSSGIPSSGTIVLPAKTVVRFPLAVSSTAAYKFENLTGESFTAIELVDSYTPGGGGNDGTTYDWSFYLISKERLTTLATLAWGPGSTDLSVNGNPVWVTPTSNTTIYVKYNGDLSSGTFTSPCGFSYDVSYPLNVLNHRRIFDVADNDQSGLAVYTCDGTLLAAAYGEDPATAGTSAPNWDVGTTILPACAKKLLFANDDRANTLVNTAVTIPVLKNDAGFLATVDPSSITNSGLLQPKNGTVSVNPDGTLLYIPNNGFTGNDTLEYSVCSTPSPVVCDVAKVFIKITGCSSPASQNLISGQVFLDINKDGTKNDGGVGFTPSKVYLYTDGNCNGSIDVNELKDSVNVDSSGTYQFSLYPEKTVTDNFDGAGSLNTCANGTDGNVAWASDWIDSDVASPGFCTATQLIGDVEILRDGSISNALRIKDLNKHARRTVNLNGVTEAYLSFSFRRKSTGFVATETDSVQVSANGVNFTTLYSITGNGTIDPAYINVFNLNISAFASANTTIRFLTNANVDDGDTVYIDNVSITYLKYPQCYITRIGPASIPANYYQTTVGQRAFSAANAATCLSNYDFGVAKNSISISGTLFNDNNGLSDATVNGTGIDAPSGVTMYAYLVDQKGNVVFKDTLDSGNGTYRFPKADVLTTYSVIISSTNVAEFTTAPDSARLPAGWVSVGDAYGFINLSGSGNESGTPNTSIPVRTGLLNITGVNFGIQRFNGGIDKTICFNKGVNTVTMSATTTPGIWSAVAGNPGTATITTPTSATTTITNFSNGGTYRFLWTIFGYSDTVIVNVTKPDAGLDFNVCGGSLGTLSGNYTTGLWTAHSGNPAGATLSSTVAGVATVNFTKSANGNYNFIFTVNGCTDTIQLTVTPKPIAAAANSNLLSCANVYGFMGELSTSNPSPNTLEWIIGSGPGIINSPYSTNSTIGALSKTGVPTVVLMVITDANSCTDTSTTTLTPPVMDSAMISKYSNEYCITCPVMDGNMLSYYDLNGKLLARVTDLADSASIGSTVFCGQLPYNVSGNPAVSDVRTVKSYIEGAGIIPQPYLPRAWNINTTNNAPMTINLYFTDQEVAALQGKTLDSGSYYYFDYAPELLLVAYPNNSDTFIPAGSPNGIVYHPTFTRVNGYWEVTFSIPQSATFYLYPSYWLSTALPVELIDLKATAIANVIDVDWSTVSEMNNLKFEIERSTNSKSFEKIGEVAGSGNSQSLIRYKYTDKNVVEGVEYFYRIKQFDYDGKNKTTDFVSAIIKNKSSMDIDLFMPNPTHNFSFIKVNCSKPEVFNFSVFDANGNMVLENNYELDKGRTLVRIDFSSLSNGLYLVFITSESGSEVRKLVVKK